MERRRIVKLNSFEYRLMVNSLNTFRNTVIREGKPTEDIDALLRKVIDAPLKREQRNAEERGR